MQELARGISLVRPEHKAVFPYSNSIFVDGSSSVMIDAGSGRGAYQPALARGVDLVLLSHYHFDHTNGLEYFARSSVMAGCEEVWAYRDEQRYLDSTGYDNWEELMAGPRPSAFGSRFIQPDDVPSVPGYRPVTISGCFRDNDLFELGITCIQAIHTPGHSPGHYAFFFPEEGILFSGDYDLTPQGPWYGAVVSDFDLLVNSVERLLALHPHIIVTSHRQHVYTDQTDDLEKLMRAFLEKPLQKEAMILDYLAIPHRLKDILDQNFVAWSPPRSSYQEFWNRMMAKKHLDRLLKRGYIIKVDKDFYVCKEVAT